MRVWVSFLFFAGAQIGVQVLSIGAAAALPGYSVNSVNSALNSEAVKSVTARCPAGKRVLGGGGRILADAASAYTKVVIESIFPSHSPVQDEYIAVAVERSAGYSGDWRLAATAICGDALPGLQIVAASTLTPSNDKFKVATANCPSGTVVIGTGAGISSADRGVSIISVQGYGSEPNNPVAYDRGVTVGAAKDGITIPADYRVTAWAVCANRPTGYQQVTQAQEPPTNAGSIQKSIHCPTGKRVLGATGFIIDDGDPTVLHEYGHLVGLSTGPIGTTFAVARQISRPPMYWHIYFGAICAN